MPPTTDEARRIEAVHATRLLGTPAEERFDRITRLACRLFGVPMAFIDLVAERMVWVKSAQGLDVFESDRRVAYCHHTVIQDDVCLVYDARSDPRLVGNPYVDICVFYAGVPLRFRGEKVGSFCICGESPRVMGEAELDMLRDLAVLAERELEVQVLSESQLQLTAANSELEVRAVTDVLTRLWNRSGIFEIAERELSHGRVTGSLGLALIDIDHFKKINDRYGHPAGDEVLRVVAQRLRAVSRPTDAVGRYGGEEFLAVLPSVDEGSVVGVCERLRLSVANEPVSYQGHTIRVTCSVGGALAPAPGHWKLDALIQEADRQLYRAKRAGRNRVEFKGAAT